MLKVKRRAASDSVADDLPFAVTGNKFAETRDQLRDGRVLPPFYDTRRSQGSHRRHDGDQFIGLRRTTCFRIRGGRGVRSSFGRYRRGMIDAKFHRCEIIPSRFSDLFFVSPQARENGLPFSNITGIPFFQKSLLRFLTGVARDYLPSRFSP